MPDGSRRAAENETIDTADAGRERASAAASISPASVSAETACVRQVAVFFICLFCPSSRAPPHRQRCQRVGLYVMSVRQVNGFGDRSMRAAGRFGEAGEALDGQRKFPHQRTAGRVLSCARPRSARSRGPWLQYL